LGAAQGNAARFSKTWQVEQLRQTLPGAAPTFQVSKTWKRFSGAGQQPGAKAWALAIELL